MIASTRAMTPLTSGASSSTEATCRTWMAQLGNVGIGRRLLLSACAVIRRARSSSAGGVREHAPVPSLSTTSIDAATIETMAVRAGPAESEVARAPWVRPVVAAGVICLQR
ncbi:MAG: hypothetical protein ACRDLV_05135 [Solirubrobacteraceae bacterium]